MNFLIGTFSKVLPGMNAHGHGIYSVSFDPITTRFGEPNQIAACENPSSLAFDANSQTIFATREVFAADVPALASFSLRDGMAVPLAEMPLQGELPCYVTFDSCVNQVAAAQYWTGDVVICCVENGIFKENPIVLQNTGTGPNITRQQGPHAHCVVFSNYGTVLHVVDLGADLIASHRLDANGNVIQTSSLQVPPGSGPRHMVINGSGSRAFVSCELSEELLVLRRSELGWDIEGQHQAFDLPERTNGAGAAIRLSNDERHLYLSGRRQSQIALFNVANEVRFIQAFETGGTCPRDFNLSTCSEWVFCGNQDCGTITALKRNTLSGKLSPAIAKCEIGSPVSILQLPT